MSRRILIVDDNPTNLRLAASVLELEGMQVDQAVDASEALARLAHELPDLILMDIALPGMDGLTLTRQLKADPRTRGVPVVALTAFAMKGDEEKARDAGCDGYLTKPIDTRLFGSQVLGFLDKELAPILIVDDHPTNLRLLRAQLEAAGRDVIEAANGVEGLERLQDQRVAGVISDILMPRMDGYRFCMELRKQPQLAALPFILYTSTYDSPADRALARVAGADAYVPKPAPVGVLLDALQTASQRVRGPTVPVAELEDPVLKQYSESLIRKLEEKSVQLGEAYEGLAQTEARLSGLVESALDAIIAIDESQQIVLFNAAAERMFGCSREQALRGSLDRFIPPGAREAHAGQVQAFCDTGGKSRQMGARIIGALRMDGSEFPAEASISRQVTSRGWICTVFLRDVTKRLEAEASLASSEAGLRRTNRVLSVLSGVNALIARGLDRDELLEQCCRIAVEEGNFPKAWIGLLDGESGQLRFAAGHGGDAAYHAELQARLLDQDSPRHGPWMEAMLQLKPVIINDLGAEPLALRTSLATSRSIAALPLSIDARAAGVLVLHAAEPNFFDSEEMTLLSGLAGDISHALDHLQQREQIRFLANYDALTRLPNRTLFTEYVGRRLKSGSDEDEMLAVVLVDLERLRRVNETLGRDAGDELLQQVAQRLSRLNDTTARLGVDVFAMKFRNCSSPGEIANAYLQLAEACFSPPFIIRGQELRIGCRAGIAVAPSDGNDAETLIHNAEAALRRARESSQRFVFYAPELNARAAEALQLESRLRRAIDRGEFVLHYQPKVGVADGRICGLEALIRWKDPDQEGLVPPGMFIPVLEECGLIGEVGDWALGQAIQDQARWRSEFAAVPRVAVNVSPLQLRRLDFADRIIDLLSRHPMAELELEITESVIMDDVERNIAALTGIREIGATVAVDDFGTGYCSLSYIAKLPVNFLKIDRAFIIGMGTGPEGLAIVSSIIALAHALRLKVVAEGVETQEQARLLHLLGCDEAQGFLYCRPVAADVIAGMLSRDQPLPERN